jgi:hypothetical protein
MVIEVNIAGWLIGKVLVDNGSTADILFLKTFEKMNLSQHMLAPQSTRCMGSEESPSSRMEKFHSQFPSDILRMPERRVSLSM